VSVRLSVCTITAAAGLLLSAGDINRRRAPSSNGAAARGGNTALSSKCGQRQVDSRVDEAELTDLLRRVLVRRL